LISCFDFEYDIAATLMCDNWQIENESFVILIKMGDFSILPHVILSHDTPPFTSFWFLTPTI
jgi:hypothetical protein